MHSTTTSLDITQAVLKGRLGRGRDAQNRKHVPTPVVEVVRRNASGAPVVIKHVCSDCGRLVSRIGGINKHV